MAALTRDDIAAVLRPAEDTVVARILGMGVTKEEFAEAYAWIQNDEALMNAGRSCHPAGSVRLSLFCRRCRTMRPVSHRPNSTSPVVPAPIRLDRLRRRNSSQAK